MADPVASDVVEQLRSEVIWLRDQLAARDAVIAEIRHAVRETKRVPATPPTGAQLDVCANPSCATPIDARSVRIRVAGEVFHEGCHQ